MCLRCLEKVKQYSPKWSFNGDLPWYKRKSHLKIIQVDEDVEPPNPKNHHKNPDHSLPNMVPRIRNKAFESSFIRDGPILAAAQCQSLQSLHCMSPETKSSISNKKNRPCDECPLNYIREFPGTPRNGTPCWEASHTIPIPHP